MAQTRYAIPHLRLVFGGTTGSAASEIWACTLKLVVKIDGGSGVGPTESQAAAGIAGIPAGALATSCAGPMKDAVTTMWNIIGGDAFQLNYLKLNAFGSNDLQETDPTVETQFAAIPGPVFSSTPWSSALDFYHRTSRASRGYASHGRCSLPTGLVVSSNTGKVTGLGSPTGTELQLPYVGSVWVAFLQAVGAASPLPQFDPAVLYTSTSTAKPPAANYIDQVIPSDIPGEVRTRQNALVQGSAKISFTIA